VDLVCSLCEMTFAGCSETHAMRDLRAWLHNRSVQLTSAQFRQVGWGRRVGSSHVVVPCGLAADLLYVMQPQASVAAEICRSQPSGNVKRRAPQLAGARLATLTQHIVQLDCITAAVPPASACASCGHVLCGDADGTGMPTAACSLRRHRRITTLRVYPSGTGGSRHCVSPERHRRITALRDCPSGTGASQPLFVTRAASA
jgi:hypothetical protein